MDLPGSCHARPLWSRFIWLSIVNASGLTVVNDEDSDDDYASDGWAGTAGEAGAGHFT